MGSFAGLVEPYLICLGSVERGVCSRHLKIAIHSVAEIDQTAWVDLRPACLGEIRVDELFDHAGFAAGSQAVRKRLASRLGLQALLCCNQAYRLSCIGNIPP